MLAWVMNMGFAASNAATQAPPPAQSAPTAMALGDELFLTLMLLVAIVWRIA